MFSNQNTNSNTEAQQLQHVNNITSSSEDLLKEMQSLRKVIEIRGKEIELLKSRGRRDEIMGIANLSLSSVMAAAFTIAVIGFALGPIIAGYTVAGIVATAALTGLGATVYQYRKEIKSGFKYAAEKTVDGAKYTAEKVKGASVYTAGKIKDGAVYVKDKIKSGTSHTVHNLSQSMDRLSSQTNYSDAMLNSSLIADDAKKKIVSVKGQFMDVFNNEKMANKDKLLKKILKDIVLQIESKKDRTQGTDSEKHAPEWDKQINFIKGLSAEKLHDLLTKQSLPKDSFFIYTIFSEHHDKIGRAIRKYEAKHELSNAVEQLNNVAGKYGIRKGSTQSRGSEAKEPLQEPFSSDLGISGGDSTNKTATVDPTRLRRSSSSNSLNGSPVPTPVAPPKPPRSFTFSQSFNNTPADNNSLSPEGQKFFNSVYNEQNVGTPTRTDSPDSGMDSGPSTPEEQIPFIDISKSRFRELISQTPPKPQRSPSPDSGMGSGPSTPEKRRVSLTMEDIEAGNPQGKLRKVDLQQQAPQIPVK